ncbi:PREDICTED: translation initiation factor IF-2-like [Chinchilla lanigera]|uniref:translation initiation factor IF-2-like n=1 Tax=Chinchilla lanigera TaxID=34839 RepID=UPI00038EF873|nr:PREDICTED: translation initiation factor IF-2-like [Chinchilla lanigera]
MAFAVKSRALKRLNSQRLAARVPAGVRRRGKSSHRPARESRLGPPPCPRAKPSPVGVPALPPRPARGRRSRPPSCVPRASGKRGPRGLGTDLSGSWKRRPGGRERSAMETTGSRPSPKLRAFLQTSHSGIHDVASSAASQRRGSFGRQHKSLIVRERSPGEGAKRETAGRRGWGGPAPAPGRGGQGSRGHRLPAAALNKSCLRLPGSPLSKRAPLGESAPRYKAAGCGGPVPSRPLAAQMFGCSGW